LSNVQGSVSTEDPSLVFASEISGSEEPLALLQIDTISYIVAPGTTDEDVMQWTSVFDQHARPAAFIFTGPGSPDANSALTLILGE
jgi:hypothetical protein